MNNDSTNNYSTKTNYQKLTSPQCPDLEFQNTYHDYQRNLQKEDSNIIDRSGGLTQKQVYELRSQILSYKHLVRNVPFPSSLNPTQMTNNLWENQKEKGVQKAIAYYRQKIEKQEAIKNMILGNLVPKEQNQKDKMKFQEDYIVEKRKRQLRQILQKGNLEVSTKERLEIELKFLNVRNIYHNVLKKIIEPVKINFIQNRLFNTQLLDRNYFKLERHKKNTNSETKSQQQKIVKNNHDIRKKIKHKQFMQELRSHTQEFMAYHRKNKKTLRKIYHQLKISNDSKNRFKNQKNQINIKNQEMEIAIKSNNMTEVIRLLKQLKNNRINQLLNQTNKYLQDLGAKIIIQKGEHQHSDNQQINVPKQEEDIEKTLNNANSVYYNLSHTVKEQITQQPTLLVGGTLKNYQITGLQWLVSLYNNNLNGILADEMGLGKTIQTISLLAYLIEFKKNYGPFLIVLPLSTISNWVSEFQMWTPSIKVVTYRGNQAYINELTKLMKTTKWQVCITTYQFILKDRRFLSKYNWRYIIVDEGHRMKNNKSKFVSVLGQYHSTHRLLLTGTPLQNNLGQLWSLLNFLLPQVFNSCDDFDQWFSMALSTKKTNNKEMQLNDGQKFLIVNRLHQVLRPFLLRRVKKEVLGELPSKVEHVVKIQLSGWQKYIYNTVSLKSAMCFENASGEINTKVLSNILMQLRKCCNHPYIFLDNYQNLNPQWIFRSSGKFQLLDRILPKLKRFNHKVLIFSQMTRLMDILEAYFQYRAIKYLRLDGSTKSEERAERTKLFNKSDCDVDVFILSTRAGGLGLNLQAADTVIIFDSDWNPQMDLQAQDRAHRIGQKNKVVVLRFITTTPIQEEILSRTKEKMNLDELFIQGGLYNLSSNDAERRKKIQDILRKTNQNSSSKSQVSDDSIINKFIARSEEEEEVYEEMDEQRHSKDLQSLINNKKNGNSIKTSSNYRLMTQSQIPKWFIQSLVTASVEKKQYGRGNRIRKLINYSDEPEEQIDIINEEDEEGNFDQQNNTNVKNKRRIDESQRKQQNNNSEQADLYAN